MIRAIIRWYHRLCIRLIEHEMEDLAADKSEAQFCGDFMAVANLEHKLAGLERGRRKHLLSLSLISQPT